jgi:hypothetical protein
LCVIWHIGFRQDGACVAESQRCVVGQFIVQLYQTRGTFEIGVAAGFTVTQTY